jgi:hypothetical protein
MPSIVAQDARECLRTQVEDRVSAYCQLGDPLLLDLLRTQVPDLQHLSVSILLNQDTGSWFHDRQLRSYLRAAVESQDTDPDFRISILYLFSYANRFTKVRGTALQLVSDPTHPALARGAAQVVRWDALRHYGYPALMHLFDSSTGILRQEAALMLLQESSSGLTSNMKPALSTEILSMLHDTTLPPETRGEAIEASEELVDDPQVRAALLSMLEKKNWFFGVNGIHAKEHSLLAVIPILAPLQEAAVRDALAALEGQLSELDPHDRADVERALRDALR